MCKEGWCVRLVQEGVAQGWEKLSEIPHKGVEQKRGEREQKF